MSFKCSSCSSRNRTFVANAKSTSRGIPEFLSFFVFSINDPKIELWRGAESPAVSFETLFEYHYSHYFHWIVCRLSIRGEFKFKFTIDGLWVFWMGVLNVCKNKISLINWYNIEFTTFIIMQCDRNRNWWYISWSCVYYDSMSKIWTIIIWTWI